MTMMAFCWNFPGSAPAHAIVEGLDLRMWMPGKKISMSPERRPVKGLQGPHWEIVSIVSRPWRTHRCKFREGTCKAGSD
jgi:hypothetical protein